MADTTQPPADEGTLQTLSAAPPVSTPAVSTPPKPRQPSRFEQLNKLYALPAPLRTFPLPTFVPHNPLSLVHILYVWVSQTLKPEPSHFGPLYQGWFSPDTRSVHVTDPRAIRGLWEQGFYGKGSLSRSEPSWLNREKTRRGDKTKVTSEEVTRKRRAERQQTKWERARKEREAIDLKLLEEAGLVPANAAEVPAVAEDTPVDPAVEETTPVMAEVERIPIQAAIEETRSVKVAGEEKVDAQVELVQNSINEFVAPVGPMELLLLPNSEDDLESFVKNIVECFSQDFDETYIQKFYAPPVGPLELLALPNTINAILPSFATSKTPTLSTKQATIHIPDVEVAEVHTGRQNTPEALKLNSHILEESELVGGSETNDEAVDGSVKSESTNETNNESPPSDAPITPKIKRQKSVRFSPTVEQTTFIQDEPPSPEHAISETTVDEAPLVIQNQEHTQLTLEEAFFLSYGLGALSVLDPVTRKPLSNEELFYLCRTTSTFPPQATPSRSPDDPFMVNYVVYHHYRSLGWTPRSGIKFSVDFMLYIRGPVFTHAEFAVLVLPSYSDPHWKSDPFLEKYAKSQEKRTWAWLSCINRVITQVKKTLILTYVDIPAPLNREQERELGIDGVLGRYKVREVVLKRWAANRMRD